MRYTMKNTEKSFYPVLQAWPRASIESFLQTATSAQVMGAIAKAEKGLRLTPHDFLALLSPAAEPHLEAMASVAKSCTLRTFGRTVQLFTPLYLANYCTNKCVYCGFNTSNAIGRSRLSPEEIEREGQAIASTGLRHILLLTGDARKKSSPEYIAEAARILHPMFAGIGVEVYSMEEEEYVLLREAGVDSLTVFQETYNESLYAELHPAGPKRNFLFRLDALHRGGKAGLRALNVGGLLGLDDWRCESFFTGLHANWLQQQHPSAEVAVSVPRMRPHAGMPFEVQSVTERNLIHIILAHRLFLPMAGITLSSRERAPLRDKMLGFGVTTVSAGVSTFVGGHCEENDEDTPQFEIADNRNVQQMVEAIQQQGFQPVFKNWEPLVGAPFGAK